MTPNWTHVQRPDVVSGDLEGLDLERPPDLTTHESIEATGWHPREITQIDLGLIEERSVATDQETTTATHNTRSVTPADIQRGYEQLRGLPATDETMEQMRGIHERWMLVYEQHLEGLRGGTWFVPQPPQPEEYPYHVARVDSGREGELRRRDGHLSSPLYYTTSNSSISVNSPWNLPKEPQTFTEEDWKILEEAYGYYQKWKSGNLWVLLEMAEKGRTDFKSLAEVANVIIRSCPKKREGVSDFSRDLDWGILKVGVGWFTDVHRHGGNALSLFAEGLCRHPRAFWKLDYKRTLGRSPFLEEVNRLRSLL